MLFFGPVGTHEHMFVLSKTSTYMMKIESSLRREEGVWLLVVTPPSTGSTWKDILKTKHNNKNLEVSFFILATVDTVTPTLLFIVAIFCFYRK
jgi:hypothetical protein